MTSSSRRSAAALPWRLGLTVLGLLVALSAVRAHRADRRVHDALRQRLLAVGTDVRQPELLERVARQRDPDHARITAARGLLWHAIHGPRTTVDDSAAALAALRLGAQLADEVASRRPFLWQPPMLAGAARWIEGARRRDPEVYANRSWEPSLRLAVRLAPGAAEPLRTLAQALLDSWFALNGDERAATTALVERVLQDEESLGLLLQPWLRVVGATPATLAVLPRNANAWEAATRTLADGRAWDTYHYARRTASELRRAELESRTAETLRRIEEGDARGARAALLAVLREAPPDGHFAAVATQALLRMPPGPIDAPSERAMRSWLDWALDRYLLDQPGLPERAVGRLAAGAAELTPPAEALAALAAGDLASAEAIERSNGAAPITESWAPYLIVKSRALAARGELPAAREALGRVHRAWSEHPATLAAESAVASAAGGDTDAGAQLDRRRSELAATRWPATAWRWYGGVATLDLVAAERGRGLLVAVGDAPERGVAVAVRFDGREIDSRTARRDGTVEFAAPIGAGFHRLELVGLAGGAMVPGEVHLVR